MSQVTTSLDDTVRVESSAAGNYEPVGYGHSSLRRTASLEFIENNLCRAIRAEVGDRVFDLRVEVIGREVVVSGSARLYFVKQLVTHAVMPRLNDMCFTNAIRVVR